MIPAGWELVCAPEAIGGLCVRAWIVWALVGIGLAWGLIWSWITFRYRKTWWALFKIAVSLARVKKAETADEIAALIPESKFVELEDARVHYVQAGEGPDVVLLHGIGASLFIWRFVFPLLQARHRVTALDLPGFGKSSKSRGDYGLDAQCSRVLRTFDALGITEARLVGSSMGGAIALWLARLEPGRFGKVAALAPATDSSMVPAESRHFAAAAPVLRHALNKRVMRTLLGAVIARRSLISDDVIDAYLEPFRDTGEAIGAFWAATSLLADPRIPGELASLEAEVLVIRGDRDLMVTRASVESLAKILRHASLATHPEGGHHIMEDEPAWTARQLEEFFSERQSADSPSA